MASPRGVVPGQLGDEELFRSIAAGFTKKTAGKFEFLHAKAESLYVEAKTVGISGGKLLDYDYLILVTGSHTRGGTPFKGLGTTEETKDALHNFQACETKVKTFVIAGAGVTGVEAAGKLALEYERGKEIILEGLSPPDGSYLMLRLLFYYNILIS